MRSVPNSGTVLRTRPPNWGQAAWSSTQLHPRHCRNQKGRIENNGTGLSARSRLDGECLGLPVVRSLAQGVKTTSVLKPAQPGAHQALGGRRHRCRVCHRQRRKSGRHKADHQDGGANTQTAKESEAKRLSFGQSSLHGHQRCRLRTMHRAQQTWKHVRKDTRQNRRIQRTASRSGLRGRTRPHLRAYV